MTTPTAAVVPAFQSELVHQLFDVRFREGTLPNLAIASNPANGFDPTRLENGTEVLFLSNPAQLGIPAGARVSPLWQNGLGLVAFRHPSLQVVGGIFLHGAIRNPWSKIREGAFQCLGGLMLFSDDPIEIKSAEQLFADGIDKSRAMKDKWQFIDENLERLGLPGRTRLGGGKATAAHPRGEEGRRNAVTVTASVTQPLGIYISGSDQNMTKPLCTYFAKQAPLNFMGAENHPIPSYGGLGDPSPWTALGVYHAMNTVRKELFNDDQVPVFFQGYGNAGRPLVHLVVKDGHPVSGIIDTRLQALINAREEGITAPLFLQADSTEGLDPDLLRSHGISVVKSLTEALALAPETVILSPNAGSHPITPEVANYLVNSSKIKANVGSSNNMIAPVDGSIAPTAEKLQKAGIYNGNDSQQNQIGALSVTVNEIGLNETLLSRVAQGVGAMAYLDIEAFRNGEVPQIARDRAASLRYNRLVEAGEAVGGHSNI